MADYSTTPQTPLERELDSALGEMLARNDALEAELARVQAKLDGLMEAFDKNGSLGILQMIAGDKNLPVEIRMRAAGLAVPYERPKYGTVDGLAIQVVSSERVRNARLKTLERDRARWAAEDAKTIEGTILGDPEPPAA
jgi:hypothetical protein